MKKNSLFNWRNINADRVVSVSAIIVSLATLLLILIQTDLVRKQQKASVLPSLMFGYNNNSKGKMAAESIFIINQGLGPAFIRQIRITNGKKTYDLDPIEYVADLENYDAEEMLYMDKLFKGRIIPANERIILLAKKYDTLSKIKLGKVFDFHFNKTIDTISQQDKAFIEIDYENVYGDKWKVRSDQAIAIEID